MITERDNLGRIARIYGEDKIHSCAVCNDQFLVPAWKIKEGKGKFCSKKCFYIGRNNKGLFEKGHIDVVPKEKRGHSLETREKMKIANRKSAKRGELNHGWKGGKRSERKQLMSRFEYKEWRKSVFERDNYTCQYCGDRSVYIHADHIIGWVENEETRFDINNGTTLCYRCHYKKTFPNVKYNEATAYKWGVPKKYRKEEPSYCK